MGLTTRKTASEFIAASKEIHEGLYEYDRVEYKNNKTPVTLICKIHGEFSIRPDCHLYLKQGCYPCGQQSSITTRRQSYKDKKIDVSKIPPIDGAKFIPVSKDYYAIVDSCDYEEVNLTNWSLSNGYAVSSLYGGMHRFIMGLNRHENMEVDHKNHNKLDNRKENLRICTRNENEYNKKPHGKSSQYKGVHRTGRAVLFTSKITKDGISYKVGTFANEVDAALAYNQKAIELFGEFAFLNKIE